MAGPFPGMDPYLEQPALWPNVHQSLITYARDQLQAQLGGHYFVGIGERIYVEREQRGIVPDLLVTGRPREPVGGGTLLIADEPEVLVLHQTEIREVYLELIDTASGDEVITVIEVLSPANKSPGRGRELYLQKQEEVLQSRSSLVEIDLLLGGRPTVAIPSPVQDPGSYYVAVSRAEDRRMREFYRVALRSRLPRIRIPLRPEDGDGVLDLGLVLEEAYRKGAFERRLDRSALQAPVAAEDRAWVEEQVKTKP